MSANKRLTVNDLYAACKEMIKEGKGDRAILLSNDDEGNGFHELLYLFTDDEKTVSDMLEWGVLPRGISKENVVLLG